MSENGYLLAPIKGCIDAEPPNPTNWIPPCGAQTDPVCLGCVMHAQPTTRPMPSPPPRRISPNHAIESVGAGARSLVRPSVNQQLCRVERGGKTSACLQFGFDPLHEMTMTTMTCHLVLQLVLLPNRRQATNPALPTAFLCNVQIGTGSAPNFD